MGEPQTRTFKGDTAEAAEIMAIVELWRRSFAITLKKAGAASPETADQASLSQAMTAAAIMAGTYFGNAIIAIMAGTYFGNAIIAGIATEQDRRRAGEAMLRNFRAGVDIGKRQGLRVAAEMPVAGRA